MEYILIAALAITTLLYTGTVARNKELRRLSITQHRKILEMGKTITELRIIARRKKNA